VIANRAMSFTTSQTADADGIKTSIATSTSAANYSGAALNGAMVTSNVAYPRFNSKLDVASYPTVTASNTVGAFVAASAVVFTGTYSGEAVTRTATLTSANGNETQFADGPMDSVTSIAVAAQADTDGTFTFGFSGLVPTKNNVGQLKRWNFMAATSGNVVVGFSDGTSDTIAAVAGIVYPVAITRLYTTTAVTVTVFE